MTLFPTSVRPAENPMLMGDSPQNTEEAGALFASLMREAAPRPADAEGSEAESADAQTGKGLPELPLRWVTRGYSPEPIVADSKLEEFAVTMGIDRSLARLLLSETTNDSVVTEPGVAETDVAPIDSSGNDTDLERPTVESMVIVIPPMLLPPPVIPPSATPVSVVDDAVARAVQEDAVSAASITPIADEDLLRWRAFGFRGVTEATTSRQSPSTETPSTHSPADETATLPTGVQLKKDLGMGRLLTLTTPTRSADVLVGPIDAAGSAGVQAASPLSVTTAPTLMAADETKTRENTRATTTLSELRTRTFNVSEAEFADRDPDAFNDQNETPRDGDRWDTQSFVSMFAPRGLSENSESGSSSGLVAGPVTSPTATPPSAELAASVGAAVIRPEAMTELPSRFRDLTSASTTHLPLPDPKMTAEDRSRTFAEAVAQRVIGQIRNENWSVSLQLEPLNMGSMDIDLSLRGTEVSATVGVANAEVRTLLEAGLPRLRETLESSGLQLAGWSFGQSGQRARGDSSPMPYVAQVYRERADDADIVTDVANAAMFRRGSDSSRAVDLFV
jgi:flagellar hook-length control protein FliK